jgi:hypothetical protein
LSNEDTPLNAVRKYNISIDDMKELLKKYDEEIKKEKDSVQVKEQSKEELQCSKFYEFIEYNKLHQLIASLIEKSQYLNTVLFLASNQADELDINRIIKVVNILSNEMEISITKEFLEKLCNIMEINLPTIKISEFFKSLINLTNFVFPQLIPATTTQKDIGLNSSNKNIELHENLLKSSQNFKIVVDEEFEKELGAVSFTMRSLYTKSGRPKTSNNLFSPNNIMSNDEYFGADDGNENHVKKKSSLDPEMNDSKNMEPIHHEKNKSSAKLNDVNEDMEEKKSVVQEEKKKEEIVEQQPNKDEPMIEPDKSMIEDSKNKINVIQNEQVDKSTIKSNSEIPQEIKKENLEPVKKEEDSKINPANEVIPQSQSDLKMSNSKLIINDSPSKVEDLAQTNNNIINTEQNENVFNINLENKYQYRA